MEIDLSSKTWWFQLTSNLLTPVVFLSIGALLPIIARRSSQTEIQ
jgi:hypothetical protein